MQAQRRLHDDFIKCAFPTMYVFQNMSRILTQHDGKTQVSVKQQYIFQLRGRLDNEQVREQLDIIREELERAGNLLVQMGESQEPNLNTDEPTSLNRELSALHNLFQDSLFRDGDIDCDLILSEESTDLSGSRHG
jgi:hypothetical protein